MGKDEDTHTGPNQGVRPENDTQNVDQPGAATDDSKE
jgi:hypothetical protein